MSEQEDLKNEGERVPLSPGSASALLLPLQVAQQANRNTNFFIDNILRPDFGCRKEPGLGLRDRAQSPERERVYPLCSVPGTPRLDSSCSNDSSSSSSSSNASPSRNRSRRSSAGTTAGSDRREGPAESSSSSSVPKNRRGSPEDKSLLWPAWVYCTRYSDRPSSGPRTRKLKKSRSGKEDKRPRTAFTAEQLQRLKTEFTVNRYITEQRRQALAGELQLNESQIKIWFQNKRAKIKKASGLKNGLALQLMAQGLYNHSTTTVQDRDSD